jgi:hypothetical protein
MSSTVTQNVSQLYPWPNGENYKEQIQWRDAATGKLLAASDFFPPATDVGPVPVGYGGMIYDILSKCDLIALQVLPQTSNTTSSSVINTTTAAPSPNSTSTASGASS